MTTFSNDRKQALKVGLFGLSANPPHYGHVKMAQYAKDKLDLDEVWWIVAAQNPLKSTEGMAPFADRVQMCRILTQPYKWLKVTDIEERCGTQRTFDTLSILTDMNPDTNFAWIMGADNLAGFHKWYKWQEIANLMPIAVLARPGETDKARMSQAGIEMTQIHAPADLIHAQSGYSILDNPMVDISSTQLRQNSERRITGTSPDVIKHIQSHQLYGF